MTMESQLASTVLMIRPVRFESNPMTAASNRFQGKTEASAGEQHEAALKEFDGLVDALRDKGINVIVVEDSVEPHTPDSIFPNNWVSFHADGRVVLYPMEAENRRTERRMDVIALLNDELGYAVSDVVESEPNCQAAPASESRLILGPVPYPVSSLVPRMTVSLVRLGQWIASRSGTSTSSAYSCTKVISFVTRTFCVDPTRAAR